MWLEIGVDSFILDAYNSSRVLPWLDACILTLDETEIELDAESPRPY
jgi:hypothetical protein